MQRVQRVLQQLARAGYVAGELVHAVNDTLASSQRPRRFEQPHEEELAEGHAGRLGRVLGVRRCNLRCVQLLLPPHVVVVIMDVVRLCMLRCRLSGGLELSLRMHHVGDEPLKLVQGAHTELRSSVPHGRDAPQQSADRREVRRAGCVDTGQRRRPGSGEARGKLAISSGGECGGGGGCGCGGDCGGGADGDTMTCARGRLLRGAADASASTLSATVLPELTMASLVDRASPVMLATSALLRASDRCS